MKKFFLFILLLIFMLINGTGLLAAAGQADEKTSIRRFALVVGANYGGKGRVKLQYAVEDAKDVLKILEDMGGVSADDSRLLVEPNKDTLTWEMNRLRERLERARPEHRRVEVIIYYSGHSDEENILLGKEKLPYTQLRDEINRLPADVRIAILDSCASGAFTRLKGGKKRRPFLVDTAYDMKGYAVMTSSSSDEASQESDRLKGSFFTHYLISGLRGAADMTQDGRITLNEAYQFAFQETLQKTEKTVSGPQHPNYDIQMTGTGDVVMTDIRQSSALLRLTEDVSGKLFIHDAKNVLVAELNKMPGRYIELGLEEGKYRIINIVAGGKGVFESKIQLKKGKTVEVDMAQFKATAQIDTVARGDINYQSRRRVFKKRGKKLNFFAAYVSKYTRAYGKSALMVGGHFGLTFNKAFSLGFAGYANVHDFPLGHPVYWGLTLEYALPSRSVFNVKVGTMIGSGEEYLLSKQFFIFEPEVGVTFNISRLLNISTGLSYRFTSVDKSTFAPFSWCFSFRLGK
ncbi:MAG: caspase family protein [bacterium]|nr:caspase family protein [bacterium]